MNDNFNEQKDYLLRIKHEISLLHQQVDFLIRNEQPLALLDLDVMMNRTHTLYDLMCGVEVDNGQPTVDSEPAEEPGFILGFEQVEEPEEAPEEVPEEVPEEAPEEAPEEIPVEAPEEAPEEAPMAEMFTTGDEIEMTIPHIDFPEEEIVYEPVVIGDIEDHDDGGFELEPEQPETLGERYQQDQEATLGEKFQHSSVKDLQMAIGINDKFLFVNELFGGSMEKYNRSMANLNDLKTLNGALIYLNELRIELQWNSSNEAYKKLLELVHRKYEA